VFCKFLKWLFRTLVVNGNYPQASEAVVSNTVHAEDEIWTSSRNDLRGWLHTTNPTLADLYVAAVTLFHNKEFPGRVILIAHSAREIGNRLPDFVVGRSSSKQFDYKSRLDYLSEKWQKSGFENDKLPVGIPNNAKTIDFPSPLYRDIGKIIRDFSESRERTEESAFRLFTALEEQAGSSRAALFPVVSQWIQIIGWFVSWAHMSLKQRECTEHELSHYFDQFESMLSGFKKRFFKGTDDIDEILEEANS